jgi:hypothetical protein
MAMATDMYLHVIGSMILLYLRKCGTASKAEIVGYLYIAGGAKNIQHPYQPHMKWAKLARVSHGRDFLFLSHNQVTSYFVCDCVGRGAKWTSSGKLGERGKG